MCISTFSNVQRILSCDQFSQISSTFVIGISMENLSLVSESDRKFDRLRKQFLTKNTYKQEIALGKRIGLYRYISELGTGNFSKVQLAVHSLLHEKVAIKILEKAKFNLKTKKLLSREINIMENLPPHPNIIQLFEVHDSPSKLHFMMEYAAGGELYHLVVSRGRLDERSAKIIFKQINEAVSHLHSNLMIHRDLKAENVFFAGPLWIKLGDFGFSTNVVNLNQCLDTFCGSPPYAAPELYVKDSYFGPSIDHWAMGVLLYFITTGILPFRADNVTKLKQLILACNYSLPIYLSGPLKRLIESLLNISIPDRATSADIANSDWFEDVESVIDSTNTNVMGKHHLSHEQICLLLFKWFRINSDEIEEALVQGPTNSLTGVYRLLKVSGSKYISENEILDPNVFSIESDNTIDEKRIIYSEGKKILRSEVYIKKSEKPISIVSLKRLSSSKKTTSLMGSKGILRERRNNYSTTCNLL